MHKPVNLIKLIAAIILVSSCFEGYAQTTLPLNEEGKVSFSEVIKADSVKNDFLFTNASSWLDKKEFKKKMPDTSTKKITAMQELMVYDKGYLFKRIHGKITFTATIEVKDNKYKYTFTDFVYHYYKEDRNHKMVPTRETKPLEDKKAPGWQALWQEHKSTTLHTITNYANNLKAFMLIIAETKKEPAMAAQKKTNENW